MNKLLSELIREKENIKYRTRDIAEALKVTEREVITFCKVRSIDPKEGLTIDQIADLGTETGKLRRTDDRRNADL